MNQLILLLAVILGLATLVPISRNARWWIRALDFPRLQLLFLAISIFILAMVFTDSIYRLVALPITCLCILYHLYWIYPYTFLVRPEVESIQIDCEEPTLSLLTANVLMTNRNAEKFLELVQSNDPDILLTLESDKWWEEKLGTLDKDYPYSIKCPLDNLYGMHLYSRLPLHENKIDYLVEDGVPSFHTIIELSTETRIRAHFLHPSPPMPEYSSSTDERDAELVAVAKSVQDCDLPIIVAGDLNDVAWSETTRLFRKISGLLDPRVGRGMFNTFNAKHWFMRWPLDHLFHSDHFQICDIRRLEYFGSDHFAFFTKLAYRDRPGTSREGLDTDNGDHEFAEDKLDRKNVSREDVPLDETKN
ncbi:MAG: endonuclease [Pseudohongiella sp.]|nr:MAG: endonuclease [Pseudohongiella sp.]